MRIVNTGVYNCSNICGGACRDVPGRWCADLAQPPEVAIVGIVGDFCGIDDIIRFGIFDIRVGTLLQKSILH